MSAVLWLSLLFLGYTFIGYPAVVAVLARIRPRPIGGGGADAISNDSVSVVIAMFNESSRATERLRNLLDTDFAGDRLEVIAVSDGSSDDTFEVIAGFASNEPKVRPLKLEKRSGKPASLNAAIALAKGELVIFTDARQQFSRDTIPNLVANFSDPEVGAVSGELHIEPSDSGTGIGGDLYWRLEKFTRLSESQSGSAVGCTGAIYAIRRRLYERLPEDTILDDVVVPMEIARQGYRVIFEPKAIAADPKSLSPARETRRKARTLAGNFQMLFRYPSWLNPFETPLWWRVISHKYCRLAAPLALFTAFVSSAILTFRTPPSSFGTLCFWAQSVLYLFSAIGILFPRSRTKIFTIPAAFVFLNMLVLRGFCYFIRSSSKNKPGWD